jgi:putative ABC transport system substrate-binding protein
VIEQLKVAAPSLSIELSVVNARTSNQFGSAFSAISRTHAQALYMIEDSVFTVHRATLLELASQARLPAMYAQREIVEEGGLMSYRPDFRDLSADLRDT